MDITRRTALGIACSFAAHPFITPIASAALPGDNRLVVIILRGAMDGLDVVQPIGDRNYAAYRGDGITAHGFALSDIFHASEGLRPLEPLWKKGELAFAHAVSTPYRNKRSHFDGQDILEAGTNSLAGVRDGWLNRLLTTLPTSHMRTAFALGQGHLKILSGHAPVQNWSPGVRLNLTEQDSLLLSRVYRSDELFHSSFTEASALTQDRIEKVADAGPTEANMMMDAPSMDTPSMDAPKPTKDRRSAVLLARYAANQLRKDARIVAYSLNGWDTHQRQNFALNKSLSQLSASILTLKQHLGADWENTSVLAMTEFGRTVAVNGTQGTDHGTGGAMLMAGGAIKGGHVHGIWPGLSEADLYERRDLRPTQDVRAFAAAALREGFGVSNHDLEQVVFPGLDFSNAPVILR